MSTQSIVERILSDAQSSAQAIIADAEEKAAAVVAEAEKRAERHKIGTQAEVAEKVKAVLDGKAATARLDSAKVLLKEKRRVIDAVYERALKELINLKKAEAVKLAERLLTEFAEDGDEVWFADNFAYSADVAKLDVVNEKNLKISRKTADIDGGFILCGKRADKDLSYGALLTADREQFQAEIAAKIFGASQES